MTSAADRFIYLSGEIMRIEDEITNDDPMRYAKRCAVISAKTALENGIEQAIEILRITNAIQNDVKEVIAADREKNRAI